MKVRLFASVVGLSTVALVSNGCSGDSSDGKTPAGGGGSAGAGAVGGGGTGATGGGTGATGGGGAGGVAGTAGAGATGGGGIGGVAGTAGTDAGADADVDAGPDGSDDGGADATVACSPQCGSAELCDGAHAGTDDNCDGQVDEGCPCVPGLTEPCFKGDPGYRHTAGCFDGTSTCTEQGTWGACLGGVHATDSCFNVNPGCHAIEAKPFVPVQLKPGTGNFSSDAVPGTEAFSITCPPGVPKCPQVQSGDQLVVLQSGEYSVKYSKVSQGTSTTDTCDYPLIVREQGLRVELSWEHTASDSGVDLDLHLHEPGTTTPWGFAGTTTQDCNWSNCTADAFVGGLPAPKWFADPPATPPAAVNWWLDGVQQNNTCYFAPKGAGATWQSIGKGCHNPRLDLESVSCDFTSTDPNSAQFCAPENTNIDYPPTDKWTRVGVHYFSNQGQSYSVHPEVKIFCDGALVAHLGPHGYYSPEKAVTFASSDGSGTSGNKFWSVADVALTSDACGKPRCEVQPIYADASARTPFFGTDTTAALSFVPAYPPP